MRGSKGGDAPRPAQEEEGAILRPNRREASVFVSDALRDPPVEGTQVIAAHLSRHLIRIHDVPSVAWRLDAGSFQIRSLLLVARRARDVTYLPQNGLTAATMLRATLLALTMRARVELIVTQVWLREPRRWRVLARRVVRSLVVGNPHQAAQVRDLDVHTKVLHPRTSYRPDPHMTSERAKATVGWSAGPHLLHVGHLRRGRNLQLLAGLADLGEVHIVASPYGREDPAVSLPDAIDVHRGVVADMGLWYRAADVYIFPTADAAEVSGVPMSVVEALACGTPVVALRSPMVERLGTHPGLIVVDGEDELRAAVASVLSDPPQGGEGGRILAEDECGSDLLACGVTP